MHCLFVYLVENAVSVYLININRVRSGHGNFKCHFPGLESHGI